MDKRILHTVLAVAIVAAWLVSCDDAPPPTMPVLPPAAGAPPPPPPPPPPSATAAKAQGQAELELTDKDFVEGPSNRDPFRSFLVEFKGAIPREVVRQRKVIMPRYSLDELKLIAVVTGPAVRPMAMFRDPTGLGVTVKLGDRISKNEGLIKRILREKVYVEIEEQSDEKKAVVDRVIELHPKEARSREAEEAAAEGLPVEEAPVQGVSPEQAPKQAAAPAEEAPKQGGPTEEAPKQGAPAEGGQ